MKTLNLSKHGLARVMLTTFCLITLGIGQIWGLDLYLDTHNFTDWTSSSASFKLWPGTGSDANGSKVADNLYKFTVSSAMGTMYFKRYDSGGNSQWNEFSVSYNSAYNVYKVTGWNSGSNASYNINIATKTNYIYFDNSSTNWSNTYKYFVIGHNNPSEYSKVYSMTAIEHTKLWYVANSSDTWSDATYYGFCNPTSSWSNGEWGSSNLSNGSKYTAAYTSKRDLASSKSVLFTPESSSNGATLSISSDMSYTGLNYSQTVKKYTCTAEDDGSLASQYKNSSINSGTVTISAYKMTGNGTASNSSNSATLEKASELTASINAAYTGEVTLTATPNNGYEFVGWFSSTTATTALSTSESYTYNAPKSTKTVYARFKEKRYEVKVATITPSAGGSATPTSWTYMSQVAGGDITATPNTGYTFGGWSILSGGGGYFGASGTATTSTDASTKFRPTIATSLKATFTPNDYTITLDGNGGTDGTATATYDARTDRKSVV